MFNIDINNKQTIDLSKCYINHEEGFDTEDEEWLKVANTAEPTLFSIKGLIDTGDNYVAINMFNSFKRVVEKNDNHFVLISRDELIHISGDNHIKVSLPKNMAVLDQITKVSDFSAYPDPFNDKKFKEIACLQLPIENLEVKQLREYFWVTVSLPDKFIKETVQQFLEILYYCNSNGIPVWCDNPKARHYILNNPDVKIEFSGVDPDDLYFDLPSNKQYRFINPKDNLLDEARELCNSISNAHDQSKFRAMEVAHGLLRLDNKARMVGKSQFWQCTQGVKNRSAFCIEKLDLAPNRGSQYLKAARNVEKIKPGLLSQLFGDGGQPTDLSIRSYTFYRSINDHVSDIVNLKNHSEYQELEEMLFGSDQSNNDALRALPEKIAKMSGFAPAITIGEEENIPELEVVIEDETVIDISRIIQEFSDIIMAQVPAEFIKNAEEHLADFEKWTTPSRNTYFDEPRTVDECEAMAAEGIAEFDVLGIN